MKKSNDFMFNFVNYSILGIILLSVAYPLYFILIASVSDSSAVSRGEMFFLPQGVNLNGYKEVIKNMDLWIGYRNTIIYTIIGTTLNVVLTLMGAFALARKDLKGKGIILAFIMFTMFFGGGMVPKYMLIKKLQLLDTFWVMIIPGAISVWNLLIAKTFFATSLPDELLEASMLDGCTDFQYFLKVALPLSKPIIAVLSLYYAVGHWNAFFNALMYLDDKNLYPLQLVLRNILLQSQLSSELLQSSQYATNVVDTAEKMKYSVIIIASLPILIVYPLLQRFFVKGVMIGAIKG